MWYNFEHILIFDKKSNKGCHWLKRVDRDHIKITFPIKVFFLIGLAGLFYYSTVHNIMLMIGFMQICLFLGTFLVAKEIFELVFIQKMNLKELIIQIVRSIFVYLFGLFLICLFFVFLFVFFVF